MEKLDDCIITHSTDQHRQLPGVPYRVFLASFHARAGLGPLPSNERVHGSVEAFVSRGRWIAQCVICATAVVAEPTDPFFCCPSCGSEGNWVLVVFPADKIRLEQVLLCRPGFRNAAPTRNWKAPETYSDLCQDNIKNGDLLQKGDD